MEEPEKIMKEGFESFFKARKCFEDAILAYKKRGVKAKAIHITRSMLHLQLNLWQMLIMICLKFGKMI